MEGNGLEKEGGGGGGVRAPSAHFGDRSCRQANGELLEEEGDTPSIFPGESVEEPTLLRLPSSRSGEWLQERESVGSEPGTSQPGLEPEPGGQPAYQELTSDRLETSEDSMLVVPWKSLLGWLSASISPENTRHVSASLLTQITNGCKLKRPRSSNLFLLLSFFF